MHIANRMPSSSIRVDSARISAERRLPLSDGRVRSKFQFDAEASRIQSSVCGGSLVTVTSSRVGRRCRPGPRRTVTGLSANLFFSDVLRIFF